jgi:hypothetical protein
MAGTTANYGFAYPTGTDLVRNGASAIQTLADGIDSFIGGSSGSGKLFYIAADDTAAGSGTTTSATYTNSLGSAAITASFSTGKSGMFCVVVTANCLHSTATGIVSVSVDVAGALTSSATDTRAIRLVGTATQAGTSVFFFDGNASTATTVKLAAKTSAATATISAARIQVICMG